MVAGLLIIMGIYGLSMLVVHGVHGKQSVNAHKRVVQVALVTLNNQTQIEWYIRSFLWLSTLRGKSICLTVFDSGSTDETLSIVHKLASTRHNIKVETSVDGMPQYMEEHKDVGVMVLQLINRMDNDSWIIPNW